MNKKIDPFTRTPGIAGIAYIDNGIADEIITNFSSDESSKHVYKITGLRGSGKSVEYGKIIRTLRESDNWLVYTLSAAGDTIDTLLAKLSMERFIDSSLKTTEVSMGASAGASAIVASGEGSINISKTYSEQFTSKEASLSKMIKDANKNKKKVLVGIDDISKTPETVKLLSMIGSMILEGMDLYLVVTGLSENIEDFSKEPSLSFFKRADYKETKELCKYDIVGMYQKLLDIDMAEAKKIQEITKGYAYAYQVLGSLYHGKKSNESLEDLMPEFERIMFKDSYDLIWKTLSDGEKEVIRCICRSENGKTDKIKAQMQNPSTYPVYRERLLNKHLVDGDRRGYLTIKLPHFDVFVEIWGND